MLQRIMAALGYEPRRDINDPRYWGGASVVSTAGVPVSRASGLELDVVQAVLEALAGTVSTLPFMVFERVDDDRRRPARDNPLFTLLHRRPNARQTAQEFRADLQRHLAYDRNAYARIVPDAESGHPVGALEPIHPTRVVKIERAGDGRVWYTVRALGPGPDEVLRDDMIWHIRMPPLTEDGLSGVPMYETARETFGRALAVERYGARFFRNSGRGGGIIKHPGTFKSKEDRDAFLENWREGGTGENQHRDRLLTHGVDYLPLNVTNDEAQFIDTVKQIEVKLCRLWQMPPHRVGILDRATFGNIEQQSIEYVTHTLAPWIVAWEQAASRDLLVGEEEQARFFAEFNVDGLLRGDIKARFEAFFRARQGGWLSVNDIRRMLNLEPIGPDGDRYLEPLNMGAPGETPVR